MSLVHETCIYDSDDAYLGALVPFLAEAVTTGRGAVAAVSAPKARLLGEALGPLADGVLFVPTEAVYTTMHGAAAAYHNVLGQLAREGKPFVHAVGEIPYPDDDAALSEWFRWEPLAHQVFETAALHVVCPYDRRALPEALIEHARRTHTHLVEGASRRGSADFIEPAALLESLPAAAIETAGPPATVLRGHARDHRIDRRALEAFFTTRLGPERAKEAVLAVTEIMTNAIRHGDGGYTVELWSAPDGAICRVLNAGAPLTDPCAGYRPPVDPASGGMGMWFARQLSDRFHVGSDERGPVVSLGFDSSPPA